MTAAALAPAPDDLLAEGTSGSSVEQQTTDDSFPPVAPTAFAAEAKWDGITRRGRAAEETETVTAAQEWRAVTASPYVWELCSVLPFNDILKATGGRRRDYPDWLMFFLIVAMPIFGGSARAATAALADAGEWGRFIRHVHPYLPTGWTSPLTGLPKAASDKQDRLDRMIGTPMAPPRRHHITYFLFCWRGMTVNGRKPPAHWEGVRKTVMRQFRHVALRQALQQGRFPDERFAPTAPNPTQALSFDGTVFPFRRTPTSTDDNPGMDTHLGMWVTGTGNKVYGSKFVFASTRTTDYKSRIVTDLRHVQHHVEDESGEAKAVICILEDALPDAPGIRVITCDSALRGKDVTAVQNLGPVVVNDPHVKAKANDETGTPAVYKSHLTATHTGTNCTHQIVYQHGAPHERTIDGDGNTILTPLLISEYKRYRNKNGTYRHYHVLQVPCPDGEHSIRIPLFHNDGPSSGLNFNRGEYIRVIPPGSREHKAWYGLRNDTEALHSELKKRKIRLPRNSVPGQELLLLGYLVGQNAVANAMWHRAQGQPNALDNTA